MTAVLTAPLDRPNVGRLLHHADHRAVPTRVGANRAWVDLTQVPTDRAGSHTLDDGFDRPRQPGDGHRRLLQQVVRQAGGSLAADARQLRELGRELLDGGHGG